MNTQKTATPYVVLARKWRPSQFQDIVGQHHIVRTLVNATRSERVHQAYLFTGSRGIGKTSIARIFAKLLRCSSSYEKDGSFFSCGECSSCVEISAGNSVDVIEIDGASNNGVDAIREIRENAKFLPSSGDKKIYIIDEVHMLTTAAFNALLKTLEEPPAHVVFIFATTEPHKIPATILSRCQRFDFKRVTVAQIQERLELIAQKESIQADSASLAIIARGADGSMRDALSLLDQAIAFSNGQLTPNTVRESIGLMSGETILEILSGILERNSSKALMGIHQAYSQGYDLRVLTRTLIEYLHAAILIKTGAPESLVSGISPDELQSLQKISAARSIEEMELIFQVFHHGLDWIARSSQPKIVLDILSIKTATAEILESPYTAASTAVTVQEPAPARPNVSPPTVAISASTPAARVTSWEGFIQAVKQNRPLVASLLEHACQYTLPSTNNPRLMLSYNSTDQYKHEQLQDKQLLKQVTELADQYFGVATQVVVQLSETNSLSLVAQKALVQKEKDAALRQQAENHPIIQEAKSLFGGELGPIQLME